jgi:hypothetical protein
MIDRDIRDVIRQMSTENLAPGTRAHLSLDKDCSTPA